MNEQVREGAIPEAARMVDEGPGSPLGGVELLQHRLREVDQRVRSFVRDRPVAALGMAVGAGFLVGKAITKWRAR